MFLDRVDAYSFGGQAKALEREFGISLQAISLLTTVQMLSMCVATTVWGQIADSAAVRRKVILMAGSAGWGCACLAMAFATSYWQLMVLRLINGAALGAVVPIGQSVVGDIFVGSMQKHRGAAYGLQLAVGAMGGVVGQYTSTAYAEVLVFGGTAGWRVQIATVGVCSLAFSLGVGLLVSEVLILPGRTAAAPAKPPSCSAKRFRGLMTHVLGVPSFQMLFAQGLFGVVPWSAIFSFAPLLLQHAGLSAEETARIVSSFSFSAALGLLLGGYLGDLAHRRWSETTGRVRVAQLTILLGLACQIILFTAIPAEATSGPAYLAIFFLMGLLATWAAVGCNKPILLEIVPHDYRATAMAWDWTLENTSGVLFGTALVSFLAEDVFGYHASTTAISDLTKAERAHNVQTLSRAMLIMCVVPSLCAAAIYTGLGCTYARDRARMKEVARVNVAPLAHQDQHATTATLGHDSDPSFRVMELRELVADTSDTSSDSPRRA